MTPRAPPAHSPAPQPRRRPIRPSCRVGALLAAAGPASSRDRPRPCPLPSPRAPSSPIASSTASPSAGRSILVASSIDPATLDALSRHHRVRSAVRAPEDDLVEAIADCDTLVFRSGVQITERVLRAAPRLSLVIRAGSGLDNIDLAAVEALGIQLVRIPEPGARAVAELTFGLMLMLARQIRASDAMLRQGRWTKGELDGFLLRGKRLGIVGAGNIGALVGQLGAAWGMEAVGCTASQSDEDRARLAAAGVALVGFDEVIETADFLSIHVPLCPSTRHLIDGAVLARTKPGAFLVNLARGGVVDEEALRTALTTPGRLRGAALDVHAHEGEGRVSGLADLGNVVLTPHIGATTRDTQREIGARIQAAVAAAPPPADR